ncbi:MAG: hypothetical protein AB7I50_10535 [Vicinamibacterales bacterium]
MKNAAGAELWRHRIDDGRGHELTYHFRPALAPSRAPLLVVFHDRRTHPGTEPADGDECGIDPAWNVLFPQDRFGLERGGSWWLGENGDFFMVDLVGRMLAETWQRYGIDLKALYAWGDGMGGFGALLHGLLAGARMICVSSPQVCLLGTRWSASALPELEAVFGRDVARRTVGAGHDLGIQAADLPSDIRLFHDATNFINYEHAEANPLVLIDARRNGNGESDTHAREQAGYLAQKLLSAGAPFRLEATGSARSRGVHDLQDALGLFAERSHADEPSSLHTASS